MAVNSVGKKPTSIPAPGETPWRERPLQSLQTASEIAGISVASLYRFASEGKLSFKRLAGRTLVETRSLVALLDSAEDWTPSPRTEKAREKRIERARAAWQD